MQVAARLVGAYLLLVAIAVAGLFIITPVIHDGSPDYPLWEFLNHFMAAGTVIMLVLTFVYRWRLDPENTSNYMCAVANGLFYASVVLTMLFFWEYFFTLNPGNETGLAINSHLIWFPAMDSLYTVLGLIIGERLLRHGIEQ